MEELKKSLSKKSKYRLITQPILGSATEEKQGHTVSQRGSLNTSDASIHPSDEQLRALLEEIGLNFEDLITFVSDQGKNPETFIKALQQLFDHEKSCSSGFKWAALDHLVEKYLQWPLLSKSDLSGDSKCCTARLKPAQRSVLLKSLSGLIKAYGVRGFVKGVEFTLSRTVRYFIYSMVTYRIIDWYQTGRLEFQEFRQVFDKNTAKGIDTLVRELSTVEPLYLNLILSSPLIIGSLYALNGMRGAKGLEAEKIQALALEVAQFSKSCFRNTFQEFVPPFSWFSIRSKLQKIEQLIRWDGRISPEERLQLFNALRQTAQKSHQLTQLSAMECLAKISHGVGLKDLHKLKEAGYTPEALKAVIYAKTLALQTLSELTKSHPNHPILALPRRFYATYLLWWLGFSTSTLKQKIPFSIFKAIKTALEISFLYEITKSIVTAINCPDKPGYKFAEGFAEWASDYTAECFNTRLSLFRSIDSNESFEELMAEIDKYHLIDLTELILKNLNASEFKQLLQTVSKKSPNIERIIAFSNQFNTFQPSTFNGLEKIKRLDCTLNQLTILLDDTFYGLGGLRFLDLGYNNLKTLSNNALRGVGQVQKLYLNGNSLTDIPPSLFKELIHLKQLNLNDNQLTTLDNGTFDNLVALEELFLTYNPLRYLSADVFSGLQNLYLLHLYNNQLVSLPHNLLDGLAQLKQLYLEANPLNTLPLFLPKILNQLTGLGLDSSIITPDMFDNFTHLNTLSLSGFTTIPIEIKKLNQLNSLSLVANKFTNLQKDIFKNFSQLRALFLEDNQLMTLDAEIFQSLSQLETLSVWGNQLTHLPAGIFNNLTRLSTLNLGYNQLTHLSPGIFNNLTRLSTLNLAYNQLTILPADIFNGLYQLEILDLGDNQLRTFPIDTVNHLGQLREFQMMNNRLNDTAILNLTQTFPYQLEELYIYNNYITDIGMAALVNVLPCSHLTIFITTPSLLQINDISLLQKAQKGLLEKVCSDRLCHANLPPAASCPAHLSSNSIDTADDAPALLGNNNTWLYALPTPLNWMGTASSSLPTLSNCSVTSNRVMMTAGGSALMVGSVGLGVLFYKNCTVLQSFVNMSWNFVVRCCYGKEQKPPADSVETHPSSAPPAALRTPPKRSSICNFFSFFKPANPPQNLDSQVYSQQAQVMQP